MHCLQLKCECYPYVDKDGVGFFENGMDIRILAERWSTITAIGEATAKE